MTKYSMMPFDILIAPKDNKTLEHKLLVGNYTFSLENKEKAIKIVLCGLQGEDYKSFSDFIKSCMDIPTTEFYKIYSINEDEFRKNVAYPFFDAVERLLVVKYKTNIDDLGDATKNVLFLYILIYQAWLEKEQIFKSIKQENKKYPNIFSDTGELSN